MKKNILKEKNQAGYEMGKDEEKSVKIAKDQVLIKNKYINLQKDTDF